MAHDAPGGGETVSTPERVDIEVDLAGIGSRGLAHILDLLVVGTAMAVTGLGAAWLSDPLGVWAMVLFFAIAFLLYWFYFAIFEALWQGQTPGKRALALRVQKVGGYPIGWSEALLRNLARPVDGLIGYAVGLVAMLISPRSQRLGDLLAGTVVVRETTEGAAELERLGYASEPQPSNDGPRSSGPRLTHREFEILHDFLNRRDSLDPLAAHEIQTTLAARLRQQLRDRGGFAEDWGKLSDEVFLLHLDAAYRGESVNLGPMAGRSE